MTNASITAPITSSITGLFPILHLGRPWFFYWLIPYPNKMDLWLQWRSPLVWDIFAISTYLIVSLLFWYIGLIPDLATLRDRTIPANCLWLVRARLARRGAHWARFETTYLFVLQCRSVRYLHDREPDARTVCAGVLGADVLQCAGAAAPMVAPRWRRCSACCC